MRDHNRLLIDEIFYMTTNLIPIAPSNACKIVYFDGKV